MYILHTTGVYAEICIYPSRQKKIKCLLEIPRQLVTIRYFLLPPYPKKRFVNLMHFYLY